MPHSSNHLRPPHSYTWEEWTRFTRTSQAAMMPVLFDDLLAPNLPVDAMRIVRYLWFRTWGRVQSNPWMPPQRVAECLPQWAVDEAMAGHAYAVYSDLLKSAYHEYAANTDTPVSLDTWEPPYRMKRRLWAESWDLAEARAKAGKLDRLVQQSRDGLEQEQVYPDLMHVAVTQQQLADAFGPRAVHRLGKRGRTRGSVRATLRWMEEVGLVVVQSSGDWLAPTYAFGPEMWVVLTTGDFSPSFRARFDVKSPASEPFFRLRGRGHTPRTEGFDGVRVKLGSYYFVPRAMESVVEPHLSQSVMPIVWHVVRNTIARSPETHSSFGYVAVAIKEMARLCGPASVYNPTTRGRRVSTVREAIEWCVEIGILDRKERGSRTQLSIGPELSRAFRNGRFSPALGSLLGAERAQAEPVQSSGRDGLLDFLEASVDKMPPRDLVRVLAMMARREVHEAAG